MEFTAKFNLQKLQTAKTARQVKDLYQSLKTDGQLQPVHLGEPVKQLDMQHFELAYNSNVLLNHYGGEHNKLVAFKSSSDGNCLFNSISILMFGDEHHADQLRYLLFVFIVEKYDYLTLCVFNVEILTL